MTEKERKIEADKNTVPTDYVIILKMPWTLAIAAPSSKSLGNSTPITKQEVGHRSLVFTSDFPIPEPLKFYVPIGSEPSLWDHLCSIVEFGLRNIGKNLSIEITSSLIGKRGTKHQIRLKFRTNRSKLKIPCRKWPMPIRPLSRPCPATMSAVIAVKRIHNGLVWALETFSAWIAVEFIGALSSASEIR